ncbi:MAG: DNA translocase FtsK, partial [Sphingobacteriales bacterium]
KMPHLLMAGATGQGKSVGINTIIASILYKKHPDDVKFVLVDPKKVELSLFKNIEKHFLPELPDGQEAIITDTKMVVDVLKSLCVEMDKRYDKLKDAQVRNIKEYNKKIERGLLDLVEHKKLPYIILVIDELADLMMTAGKEVELPIARLAQLARAIGIHLIVATQRPSVNIITGVIKANFPARLAFRVTSRIDSRTILDAGGAEQLIGRGDMLLSTGNDMIRLQCPFIDTDEVETVTDFIRTQPYPEPFRLNIITDDGVDGDFGDMDSGDWDPLFEDAARLIVNSQQGSTSMLQRRLKLGYNRAGRLMDQLEKAKIVGANEGSKAREVLVGDEFALEQFLSDMANKTK